MSLMCKEKQRKPSHIYMVRRLVTGVPWPLSTPPSRPCTVLLSLGGRASQNATLADHAGVRAWWGHVVSSTERPSEMVVYA